MSKYFTLFFRKFYINQVILVFLSVNGFLNNLNAQNIIDPIADENFAFEVKQIDEFIERFNNDQTFLKDYILNNYGSQELKRIDLLSSLFDRENPNIQIKDVKEFINLVNNPDSPVLLNFNDDDWFAWVKCSILYQNETREIFLLLNVQNDNNQTTKWVIQNAYADFLDVSDETNPDVFLNPISHGTDFMGLKKAFKDSENFRSYLPSNYQENQLSKFVLELQNKQILFQKVEEISYHFFQINGWIIKVENFQRKGKNSGWLISNLIPADENEKRKYKQQILKL